MFRRQGLKWLAVVLSFLIFCSVAKADRVLVGKSIKTNQGTKDIYAENSANRYVIYYSYIPGVANPGRRAHICDSIQELRDELRRARNNGWVVDAKRSLK